MAICSQAARPLPFGMRAAYFGPKVGLTQTKIATDRYSLGAEGVQGPIIVEEYDATTVVPPGWQAALDGGGNLVLSKGE